MKNYYTRNTSKNGLLAKGREALKVEVSILRKKAQGLITGQEKNYPKRKKKNSPF